MTNMYSSYHMTETMTNGTTPGIIAVIITGFTGDKIFVWGRARRVF